MNIPLIISGNVPSDDQATDPSEAIFVHLLATPDLFPGPGHLTLLFRLMLPIPRTTLLFVWGYKVALLGSTAA